MTTLVNRPRTVLWLALSALALALPAPRAAAQQDAEQWLEQCRRGERPVHCEVREHTLASTGALDIDAGPNGGVLVNGWDRDQVLVRARVRAQARSDEAAREIGTRVQVQAAPGRVSARGPEHDDLRNGESWSVSYEVWAPRRTDLELSTVNGGLSVNQLRGEMQLVTTNGGISLRDVGGRVRGTTTNGGINVALQGGSFEGQGMELVTTNGGVSLAMPQSYSASLSLSTVHGGISGDVPVTRRGWTGGTVETQLGQGGAPIRISTTNGGVRVSRR